MKRFSRPQPIPRWVRGRKGRDMGNDAAQHNDGKEKHAPNAEKRRR